LLCDTCVGSHPMLLNVNVIAAFVSALLLQWHLLRLTQWLVSR
jgi:hypothetical protein